MIFDAPSLLALPFLAAAAGIAGWQLGRASRCGAHRTAYGWIAWGLAGGCVVTAGVLVTLTQV